MNGGGGGSSKESERAGEGAIAMVSCVRGLQCGGTEGHVGVGGAIVDDRGLGLREERARGGLALHEPAVIEAELGLGEDDGLLLFGREVADAGQRVWVVPQHVAQCEVMVVDGGIRLRG